MAVGLDGRKTNVTASTSGTGNLGEAVCVRMGPIETAYKRRYESMFVEEVLPRVQQSSRREFVRQWTMDQQKVIKDVDALLENIQREKYRNEPFLNNKRMDVTRRASS